MSSLQEATYPTMDMAINISYDITSTGLRLSSTTMENKQVRVLCATLHLQKNSTLI